jgi:DNA-binding response OmpR family regulator
MSALCPCCKQPFTAAPGLHIDLNTNTLYAGDKSVRVSPREAEFLEVLINQDGQLVPMERIMARVFGTATDAPDRPNLVAVYLCRLRPVVEKLGYRIENVFRVGYRVVSAKNERVVKSAGRQRKRRLPVVSESVSNSPTQIHA